MHPTNSMRFLNRIMTILEGSQGVGSAFEGRSPDGFELHLVTSTLST